MYQPAYTHTPRAYPTTHTHTRQHKKQIMEGTKPEAEVKRSGRLAAVVGTIQAKKHATHIELQVVLDNATRALKQDMHADIEACLSRMEVAGNDEECLPDSKIYCRGNEAVLQEVVAEYACCKYVLVAHTNYKPVRIQLMTAAQKANLTWQNNMINVLMVVVSCGFLVYAVAKYMMTHDMKDWFTPH